MEFEGPIAHSGIVYWGKIGIVENKMEATIMGYVGFRV